MKSRLTTSFLSCLTLDCLTAAVVCGAGPTYLDCLLDFERHAETIWHTASGAGQPADSGYWGDGNSSGNGGIRGSCGVAVSYATVVRSLPGDLGNPGRLAKIRQALNYAANTHVSGTNTCIDGLQWGHRSTLPYGLGGVTSMAMAGVDLALYDLVAKAQRLPVYKILGGQTKEAIPCCATIHPDYVDSWRDRGFLGVKIAAPWGVESSRDGIKKMEKLVAKLRKNLGDDMEIMIDCYLSWDIEFATRVAERVREYDVKWFEDPLQNGWTTGDNRLLRDRISPILLATGNLEFHPKAFQNIIHNHATDIIQPEMQWCGDLIPARWIAAMAKP